MKRLLSAGFALAGMCFIGMGVAAAEDDKSGVTITGDARARIIYKDKYDFGNSDNSAINFEDSRVRFVMKATAAGGAYAKARMRLVDSIWNGPSTDDSRNIWVDYAYIGVPIGPTVLEAGQMKSNITKFLEWDQTVRRFSLDWKHENYQVIGFFDNERNGQDSSNPVDVKEDNDWMVYGILFKGDFNDNWYGQLNLMYSDDQRSRFDGEGNEIQDKDGFEGSLFVRGMAANFKLETELAYKEANVLNSRDENSPTVIINQEDADGGWGWYGKASYPMGSFTTILNVGLATDNFLVDNDFGWIMTGNGNNEPIAVFSNLGGTGDWYWVAPSVSYAASERLSFVGNLVWVNIDGNDNVGVEDRRLAKLLEISGSVEYVISKGATFTWKAGYLQPDFDGRLDGEGVEDDAAIGTYVRFQVNF